MATPTPATIFYKPNANVLGDTNEDQEELQIRFHAVISEDHDTSAEVTSYPAMNGFEIATHAIRKNRIITIEAIFSNVQSEGTIQPVYGGDTNRQLYSTLKALVQSSSICRVLTNLGEYTPVIFTKFKTKQEAGMVDSMKVTLVGSEIQVNSDLAKAAPTELSFTALTQEELEAYEEVNGPVGEGVILTKAKANLGEDFKITTKDCSGNPYTLTYVCTAYDPYTGYYKYEVHNDNTEVVSSKEGTEVAEGIDPCAAVKSPFSQTISCTVDALGDTLGEGIDLITDTTNGFLSRTIYGVLQQITSLGGSALSNVIPEADTGNAIANDSLDTLSEGASNLVNSLVGASVDCISATVSAQVGAATGGTYSGDAEDADSLVGDLLGGVKGVGDATASGTTGFIKRPMTIFKKSPKTGGPLAS